MYRKAVSSEVKTIAICVPIMEKAEIIFAKRGREIIICEVK